MGREDAVVRRCRQGARGVVVLFASYKARCCGVASHKARCCGVVCVVQGAVLWWGVGQGNKEGIALWRCFREECEVFEGSL